MLQSGTEYMLPAVHKCVIFLWKLDGAKKHTELSKMANQQRPVWHKNAK